MSYQSIDVGETQRFFTVVAREDGSPIVTGDMNYVLMATSGANAGKTWNNATQTWTALIHLNPMTHVDQGHWKIDLTSSPFVAGVKYLEYISEPGGLYVPQSRHLKAEALRASQESVDVIAAVFPGITSLATWLRGLFRKDAMDATAKSEINAGAGAFNEATDSLEAIRDRGDAAWITGVDSYISITDEIISVD